MGRRRTRTRRDMMLSVPPGHWREAEVLAEQGFPERRPGEPYVVVVHKRGAGAFVLDGAYNLIEPHIEDSSERVRLARIHHAQDWDGWLPTQPDQMPWWATKGEADDFIAYWVAE